MSRSRAPLASILAIAALAGAGAYADTNNNAVYKITDKEYYEMPQLFVMDEYDGCLASGHAYCVGSFELGPATPAAKPLFERMQLFSSNWVENFNHTRLHRALCLQRSCAGVALGPEQHTMEHQFFACVNSSMMTEHSLWARPLKLDYCSRGPAKEKEATTNSERGFAAFLTALLALAALSTALDLTLPDHTKKTASWALSFSVVGSWRALHAPVASDDTDLRALDGLRVLCMMCVLIEHVCWLATQAFVQNTREYELMRRTTDVMLMINSTLVVQIFFLMSSFLLAHKLLSMRRRGRPVPCVSTFCETMFNRIMRISPSYWFVVWFAASWWAELGRGPLWAPLVEAEARVCQRKWWTHLLYLNNVIYPNDKCLIQTWYLAADMQLYALSLVLTLALLRWRRGALLVLSALFVGTIALLYGLAYAWRLVPTYVMHNPELVRAVYSGEASFNVLYQSPLSNSPGALAGLLLAHAHHALKDHKIHLNDYKVFRWISLAAPPLSVWWAAMSPMLLGEGAPGRAGAAALAAVERPVFALFVALGLLGAMHHVKSPLRTLFSWGGWAAPARLSFGVLLLHLPLNKSLVGNRLTPSQINRQVAIFDCFGVAVVSYACALPLALLIEYPAMRLHRSMKLLLHRAQHAPPQTHAHAHAQPDRQEKTDAD